MKDEQKYSISVVIPVRNGGKFLHQSLISVFQQNCTDSFEVIVIDDGSTDNSISICEEFKQFGIKILKSPGKGISAALNYGVEQSNSDLIARHDADDVMLQNRLQNQLSFMRENQDHVLLGGQIEFLINTQLKFLPNYYPETWEELETWLAQGCYLAHPTVMFRKSSFYEVGGYREYFDGAEDYDLWLRMSTVGKIGNLTKALTQYRVHDDQVTKRRWYRTHFKTALVRINWICRISNQNKLNRDGIGMKISRLSMARHLVLEILYFAKDHLKRFIDK